MISICEPGAMIDDRYRIVKKLGKGAVSRVMEAIDTKTGTVVALKASKDKTKCRKAVRREIMVLEYIVESDPYDVGLCAKMLDSFSCMGHLCVTFELLGRDVYHFMRHNQFVPFPLHQVRHIAYQLCYAVEYLHQRGIIHTDIKPDNILFVDSSYTKEYDTKRKMNIRVVNCTDIRLIDFGCAANDERHRTRLISNRCYRAPEVFMSRGWSHPVDVWSIGCVLFELYTGNLLFNTSDDDVEHLAIMEKILGPLPAKMTVKREYFELLPGVGLHQPLRSSLEETTDEHMQLFDLMEKMLVCEPSKRIMLKEALQHQFFEKLPPSQQLAACH